MQAILLPTDFSATAKSAAMYAVSLARQTGINRIVLYHSYEIPVSVDPITPGVQMIDLDTIKESAANQLADFELQLKPFATGISIELLNEYGALTEGLDEVCENVNADLVVMGITGGGVIEEKIIGSNTVSVAKHTKVPVIIVPVNTKFTPVRSVLVVSDFDKNEEIPVNAIRKIVKETQAKLFVLDTHAGENKNELYPALQELTPEYHISANTHFVEAINEFIDTHAIDLVISIPKDHGFFAGLFSESHTKMLAFHSHVPVMVAHV